MHLVILPFLVMIWIKVLLEVTILQMTSAGSSPYLTHNFTWLVKNQVGDIVSTSTSIGTQPHWPILEVDLCKLALGASEVWGTPSHYMP